MCTLKLITKAGASTGVGGRLIVCAFQLLQRCLHPLLQVTLTIDNDDLPCSEEIAVTLYNAWTERKRKQNRNIALVVIGKLCIGRAVTIQVWSLSLLLWHFILVQFLSPGRPCLRMHVCVCVRVHVRLRLRLRARMCVFCVCVCMCLSVRFYRDRD